jgi:hypothetical protein
MAGRGQGQVAIAVAQEWMATGPRRVCRSSLHLQRLLGKRIDTKTTRDLDRCRRVQHLRIHPLSVSVISIIISLICARVHNCRVTQFILHAMQDQKHAANDINIYRRPELHLMQANYRIYIQNVEYCSLNK